MAHREMIGQGKAQRKVHSLGCGENKVEYETIMKDKLERRPRWVCMKRAIEVEVYRWMLRLCVNCR